MHVRARCRYHNAYGLRCDARIPEEQKHCSRHTTKGKEAKRIERNARAAEAEMRKRECEIAAYRKRIDPGPLALARGGA